MRDKLKSIKEIYDKGGNIIDQLKRADINGQNTRLAIEISYDMQAGLYIKKAKKNVDYEIERAKKYANIINSLNDVKSLLEVGVGEATTLSELLKYLSFNPYYFGIDISFSRILYAKKNLKEKGLFDNSMYMADMFDLPFSDNSIDIVFSNHSLEPNGGYERDALNSLLRVAQKYVVLFEPIYELGNEVTKRHIEKHGYIKNLYEILSELNCKVIHYELLYDSNPYSHNNTGVIIVEKQKKITSSNNVKPEVVCPITKRKMEIVKQHYYCKDSMLLYPIISYIPCLTPNNAIIASHYINVD